MQLKDISVGGLYKIVLVVNFLITLSQLGLFLLIKIFNPEVVTITVMPSIKIFGLFRLSSADPVTFWFFFTLAAVINIFIYSFFQAAFVKLLSAYTPLGLLRVSSEHKSFLSDFD